MQNKPSIEEILKKLPDWEEPDLEGYQLTSEKENFKSFKKGNETKTISDAGNYTVERNYLNGDEEGLLIGRMKAPFLHPNSITSTIYLIEKYRNGQMIYSVDFYDDASYCMSHYTKGIQTKQECFYSNGHPESIKHWNEDEELDGLVQKYFENGQLELEEYYKQGELNGKVTKYFANGKLRRTQFFENGVQQGEQIEVWADGGTKTISTFKNGRENGMEKTYFPNGQLMREGIMKNGQRQGQWTWYNENGCLSLEENYSEDKLHGKRIIYDEMGQKPQSQVYDNDERIK